MLSNFITVQTWMLHITFLQHTAALLNILLQLCSHSIMNVILRTLDVIVAQLSDSLEFTLTSSYDFTLPYYC